MSNVLQFPQGPIIDPQTNALALDWFMFLQQLNEGLAYLMTAMQQNAAFASVMIGDADRGDADAASMMGFLPGPAGQDGKQGLTIPGMDGEDGDDLAYVGFPEEDHSSFGEMTITANGTGTTITLQNTYYKQTAGWVAGDLDDFTFSTDTLTATRGGNFLTTCTLSAATGAGAQVYRFAIFKSGSLLTEHLARFKLLNAADVSTCTITGVIAGVVIGDTFDLRIYNETSAGDTLTISDANFSIIRI